MIKSLLVITSLLSMTAPSIAGTLVIKKNILVNGLYSISRTQDQLTIKHLETGNEVLLNKNGQLISNSSAFTAQISGEMKFPMAIQLQDRTSTIYPASNTFHNSLNGIISSAKAFYFGIDFSLTAMSNDVLTITEEKILIIDDHLDLNALPDNTIYRFSDSENDPYDSETISFYTHAKYQTMEKEKQSTGKPTTPEECLAPDLELEYLKALAAKWNALANEARARPEPK